jgi:nitrate reductase assembly molybdenum cofactor insertion protein NarJ
MIANREHYALLGQLFKYPTDMKYVTRVNECYTMIQEKYPELAPDFSSFVNFVNTSDFFKIEETFNLTFHIQAICYLDLGYVLFGEDYKRGEFLVNMKVEHEKINHDYGCELADNLPVVLELVSLIKDEDFLDELGVRILIPALEKMTKEFDQARIALRQKINKKKERVVLDKDENIGSIYSIPIQTLYNILRHDFAAVKFDDDVFQPEYGRNFLTNCGTCSTSHAEPIPTLNIK